VNNASPTADGGCSCDEGYVWDKLSADEWACQNSSICVNDFIFLNTSNLWQIKHSYQIGSGEQWFDSILEQSIPGCPSSCTNDSPDWLLSDFNTKTGSFAVNQSNPSLVS